MKENKKPFPSLFEIMKRGIENTMSSLFQFAFQLDKIGTMKKEIARFISVALSHVFSKTNRNAVSFV